MEHPIIATLRARRRELGISRSAVQIRSGMARGTFDRRENDCRCAAIEQLDKWAAVLGYRLTLVKDEQEPIYWS